MANLLVSRIYIYSRMQNNQLLHNSRPLAITSEEYLISVAF